MKIISISPRLKKPVVAEALKPPKISLQVEVDEKALHPEWALKNAIRNTQKKHITRDIFFTWPNAYQASLRLAGFITNLYPNEGSGSLLETTIARSVDAYVKVKNEKNDHEALKAYLESLTEAAVGVLQFALHGQAMNGEMIPWEPFSEPVSLWVKKKRIKTLTWSTPVWAYAGSPPKAEHGLRYVLAGHIMTFGEMTLIEGKCGTNCKRWAECAGT